MNHMEQYWATIQRGFWQGYSRPPMKYLLDLFVAYCLCLHFRDCIELDELGRTWIYAHKFEEAVMSITLWD
ncbi:MAG: hypothetical protein ACXABY_06435 [Candidatus Thorarchaeota archaeon]|jgi:hypothetical protein